MTTTPQPAFSVTAQTINALVSGQPDIENRFGPGRIRPDGVRLSYRGQHIDARVDGRWVRETGALTTERLDQRYTVRDAADIAAWPNWLSALATLLRPTAVPVPPSAPADRAAALLALATVLEIPRPGTAIPLQLRRSYGHADRWAICDREGRRWDRELGCWVYEAQGLRDEAQRDSTRFTLAEAVPLARELADPSRVAGEARQDETQADGECCGAEPPSVLVNSAGTEWVPGDCWCTLPPRHDGEHQCGPCAERHGAPGWTEQPAAVSQPVQHAPGIAILCADCRAKGHAVCMPDEPVVEPHCDGFPTTCPHPVAVPPAPPRHGGGIRCGCYDEPAVSQPDGEA